MRHSFSLICWLSSLLVYVDASTCNTTFVDGYKPTCQAKGWVQFPAIIKTATAATLLECAGKCLATKTCKSHRYIISSKKCILYSKYLEDMELDKGNYLPGILNERQCYSNNCEVIESCKATSACELVTDSASYDHRKFVCSYGQTASTKGFRFSDILLDGALTPCEAVLACMDQTQAYRTIDIHYHLPNRKWVCRTINDNPDDCYYYYNYPNAGYNAETFQAIGPARYTVRNDSVGMAYGYEILPACY